MGSFVTIERFLFACPRNASLKDSLSSLSHIDRIEPQPCPSRINDPLTIGTERFTTCCDLSARVVCLFLSTAAYKKSKIVQVSAARDRLRSCRLSCIMSDVMELSWRPGPIGRAI